MKWAIAILLLVGSVSVYRWKACESKGGIYVYSTCLRKDAAL